MSCYHPITALDYGFNPETGNRKIKVFKPHLEENLNSLKDKYGDQLLLLPCGHCIGCAMDYSRQWSSRIMLEASKYDENCFITLTYSDEFVKQKLDKKDLQKFFKRFRKAVAPRKIRYFACGEYGESTHRPHYHAIIFGYDFHDKELLKKGSGGNLLYTSAFLNELWPFGITSIGSVDVASAAYVARYSMKKRLTGIDNDEFLIMSRRPGIACDMFDESFYDTDKIYGPGFGKTRVPRYFDKKAEAAWSDKFIIAKGERLNRLARSNGHTFLRKNDYEEENLNYEEEIDIFNNSLKVRPNF